MDEGWSIVEVNRVGRRSRLTSCLAVAPLKTLGPKAAADYSTAVLSSYGGGLVAGDCARLRVRCGRGAKLFLGTQAFTKFYKATDGQVARQEVVGHLESGACVVSLPDPVVPYATVPLCRSRSGIWARGPCWFCSMEALQAATCEASDSTTALIHLICPSTWKTNCVG